MSRVIVECSAAIEGTVQREFSQIVTAQLKPTKFNGNYLLSSDVCIRLARKLAIAPEYLAAKIIRRLGSDWSNSSGYLHRRVSSDESSDLVEDFPHCFNRRPICVFLPRRQRALPFASMTRIAAQAVLQAWMANQSGYEATLYIGEKRFDLSDGSLQLGQIFVRVISELADERNIREIVDDQALSLWEGQSNSYWSFFFAPGDVHHSLWKRASVTEGFDDRVSIYIAERSWLKNVEAPPQSFSSMQGQQQRFLALILHLVHCERGVDVDWNVGFLEECSNITWLNSTIQNRADALEFISSYGPDDPMIEQREAKFLFLTRFTALAWQYAIYRGEVSLFVDMLLDLLLHKQRILNNPGYRIAAARKEDFAVQLMALVAQRNQPFSSIFSVD